MKEAEKYKDQDDKMRKKIEAKNALEGYCANIKHTLNDSNTKLPQPDKDTLLSKVNEVENWLSSNQNAELSEF